ncbi:hypothetical protein [Billgrantia ethanolica]|uniref:Uncharacterized protein n=1 Tax=Billgrantia ethanolica TaxID=2733486 RepID=A0ABS9A7C0_9GAMM|nr:hypothetical protein [Halomonas ethanolica]MCE8004253.1 hypothetical protein [Halomonas ethanolica]
MNDVTQRWSSRKFAAAMVWQAVMVWLLIAGHLPVEVFETLTFLLLGGYILGNVAQHVLLRRNAS